jgi:transcriptional regulator NrdR family protein
VRLRCCHCGELAEQRVVDSRVVDNDAVTRRRRECMSCGGRYSTLEQAVGVRRVAVVSIGHSVVMYRTRWSDEP